MSTINIEATDIDALIDSIEFSLVCDKQGIWHIVDLDGEVCFSSCTESEAILEIETNYITPEQMEAVRIQHEVWAEIDAEDRANRALSCDHYAGF
jgi:hypothetical protein